MSKSRKKGQFFLLGAFLICALLFAAMPRPSPVSSDSFEDIAVLADNLRSEMPNAFNLGLKSGDWLATMKNFTWFADSVMKRSSITFAAVLGFGGNISTSDFNISVLNYYGSSRVVNITIGTTVKQLVVAYNQSNSTTFSSTGTVFNISLNYAGEEWNSTWARDKNSMYGMVRLSRGGSVAVRSFEG